MTGDPSLGALLEALRTEGASVVVPVHARPGSHRDAIAGVHAGALAVTTSAPPEGGRATKRIGATLAAALGVPPSRVRCVAGSSSRSKRYCIDGLTRERCLSRLEELLT